MSEQPQTTGVPTWTLGWRLRRALEHADVSREEMASTVGYAVASLSRWMHDQGAPPRPVVLREWAMRCGVDPDWLADGESGPAPATPGGPGGLPHLDSNQKPFGFARRRQHAAMSSNRRCVEPVAA